MYGFIKHSPERHARRGASILLGVAVAALLASPAVAVDVIPIGNSITSGDGSTSGLGFRDLLLGDLNGIGFYDFVGSSGTSPHEGHFMGSVTIEQFYPGSFGDGGGTGTFDTTSDMDTFQPEAVLVHVGTNDINSFPPPFGPYSNNHGSSVTNRASGELGDFVKFLLQWHDGTNATSLQEIYLSRIIPVESRDADMVEFNREVVRMVLDFRNGAVTGSPEPVYLVDHYRHFSGNPDLFSGNAGDWMNDSLHPNDAGYAEMSDTYTNVVDQVQNDPAAPDAVTDLQIATISGTSVLVLWTNTGDNGMSGDPSYADVRYATGTINAGNFADQDQSGDYDDPGAGGSIGSTLVTGLSNNQSYTLAMKLMDDASNLSGISNVVTSSTTGDDGTFVDAFDRTVLGPDWSADPEFSVNGSELVNGGIAPGEYMAIFTGAQNATAAQFDWASTADAAGIDQGGIACRLETADPTSTNGYIVFRNTEAGQGAALFPIQNGVIVGPAIDTASPGAATPGPGDTFRVLLTSDGSGHHFSVFVNGAFDAMLTDPAKLHGNSDFYCGYIGGDNLNDDIDNFRLDTVTSNQPPMAFELLSPADAAVWPNLTPLLEWEESTDPNPGDLVTYTLSYGTSPSFDPGQTTELAGLEDEFYGIGSVLAAGATYYWKVEAEDPFGETAQSSTWSFSIDAVQQVLDDFERADIGADWDADPGYSLVSGELSCSTPSFEDIAVYLPVTDARAMTWTWSEGAVQDDIDAAGVVFMEAGDVDADGYFLFRKTIGSQRWSLWEIQNGSLVGSLGIDTIGLNAIPAPGDQMRVTYTSTPGGNVFDCFINGVFDARLTDVNKLQVNDTTVHGGLLLGQNFDNNVEDVAILGSDANVPPQPFSLLEPGDGTIVFDLSPTLSWEEALDGNPGDVVTYTVEWDFDLGFGSPTTLPPTTSTSTPFTGSLVSDTPYYWRVQAEDSGGGTQTSTESWSFSLAQTLSVMDDFNRADLGPSWVGDSSMQIVSDELANTSSSGGTDLAIYADVTNPDSIEFTWGASASSDGIRRGGLAVMMDAASANADGYYVRIDPVTDDAILERIVGGAAGTVISSTASAQPGPGAGDVFRATVSTDVDGHHFDLYVNGVFYARVSDSMKLEGNGANLYAGVALRGNQQNNVDDFAMTAFVEDGPPTDFNLLSPAYADTGVAVNSPMLSWEVGGGSGVVYTVYLHSDSTFVGADSVQVQGETMLTWASPLALDTAYFWRVRASDGDVSVFNLLGWYPFRTTVVTPVELASFAAEALPGEVVLTWETSAEVDHLGFHVWRSLDRPGGAEQAERITDQLIRGDGRGGAYELRDAGVIPGRTYLYELEAIDRSGGSERFGPVSATASAPTFRLALRQNVPNPFNPSTTIGFELDRDADVRLTIFDVRGRTVRRLEDGRLEPGSHQRRWDGRSDAGVDVHSGVYFYRLEVGDWSQTMKMLLVR